MKNHILTLGLVAGIVIGAQAQSTPQSNQTVPQAQSGRIQNQDSRNLNFPYMNSGNYNSVEMGRVPENIRTTFQTDYSDVNDAQWEYNQDVYRSNFLRDGKRWSVLYGIDGRVIQTETQASLEDLPSSMQEGLRNKNVSNVNQIQVGNQRYYSTQIDGQNTYFDANGKSVQPSRRRP